MTVALATTLIFFIGGYFYWHWLNMPVDLSGKSVEQKFIIERGENLSVIAKNLEEKRLIRSALAFKIYVLERGLANKIPAGDFWLSPTMTYDEIIERFNRATNDVQVTFPEGWRKEEYGRRLASVLDNFDYQLFLEASQNFEGKLFPDTYKIDRDAKPKEIIKILTANFDKRTAGLLITQETLILASLVEREVRDDPDRSIVAGILLKRLGKKWPLQVDASVQYALANSQCGSVSIRSGLQCNWWPVLGKADLEIKSPYNTYKHQGLPPAPICNPGLASIRAVLNPQPTDYWYYLSDPAGTIHYAKTAEEHQKNIEKYLL